MEEDFEIQFGEIIHQYQNDRLNLVEARKRLADLLRHRSRQPGPAIGFDVSGLSKLDPRLGLLLTETFGELSLLTFEHANVFADFDDAAKRTMARATTRAMLKGATAICPEDVLLGLIDTDSALLTRFLGPKDKVEALSLGVEARATTCEGGGARTSDPLLSEECSVVLLYAKEEAQRLSQKSISTHHILMGLLRQENGLASKILREHGFELSRIRNTVI